ncbi:hypothetical protein [Lacticaseibacillus absianus]|uniref:hypothetical protein n=1 Tax=Lacticaseibacillus absianus TaxID=2729623 RepID=UPI0015C9CD34|nr:hypothetical protein [Lacticaseibacillus absianus]
METMKGALTVNGWIVNAVSTRWLTSSAVWTPEDFIVLGVDEWFDGAGRRLDLPPQTVWMRFESRAAKLSATLPSIGMRLQVTGIVAALTVVQALPRVQPLLTQIAMVRRRIVDQGVLWLKQAWPDMRQAGEKVWLRHLATRFRRLAPRYLAGQLTLDQFHQALALRWRRGQRSCGSPPRDFLPANAGWHRPWTRR